MIRSELYRLRRSFAFRLCVAAGFLLSAVRMLLFAADADPAYDALEFAYFDTFPLLPFFVAALCAIFLGALYSDGTIRNKIIIGNRRESIYISSLAASVTAALGVTAAMLLGGLAAAPAVGLWRSEPTYLLSQFITLIMGSILMGAFYTAVGMNTSRKALSAVIMLLAAVVLFFTASLVNNALDEQELVRTAALDAQGNVAITDPFENPEYVGGTARIVCEYLRDLLPSGQAIQIANNAPLALPRILALSVTASALVTAVGMAAFRRKDIK